MTPQQTPCEMCHGTGRDDTFTPLADVNMFCARCNGTGSIPRNPKPNYEAYICHGLHCKCMQMTPCGNYHNGDHTCPSSNPAPQTEQSIDDGTLGSILKKNLDKDDKGDMALIGSLSYDLIQWNAREVAKAREEALDAAKIGSINKLSPLKWRSRDEADALRVTFELIGQFNARLEALKGNQPHE